MIRVIFEFESESDAQAMLDTLDINIGNGRLMTTGKWSWGAESVESIELGEFSEHDNDN